MGQLSNLIAPLWIRQWPCYILLACQTAFGSIDGIQGEWWTSSLPVHSSMLQAFSIYLLYFLSFHSNCSKSDACHLFVSNSASKVSLQLFAYLLYCTNLLSYCHVFKLISYAS